MPVEMPVQSSTVQPTIPLLSTDIISLSFLRFGGPSQCCCISTLLYRSLLPLFRLPVHPSFADVWRMAQPTKFSSYFLLLVLLTSPALGFTYPQQIARQRHASTNVGECRAFHLSMSGPNSSDITRSDFLSKMASGAVFMPSVANGFDGGVGGLGKIIIYCCVSFI